MLLAALLDTTRQVADTGILEARTRLTQYVHDQRILEVAMSVAKDSQATVPARLAAIRSLIWTKSPGHMLPIEKMYSVSTCFPPTCRSSYEGHFYGPGMVAIDPPTPWPVFGKPMHAQYVMRIDAALQELAALRAPVEVQRAAAFALRFPAAPQLNGR